MRDWRSQYRWRRPGMRLWLPVFAIAFLSFVAATLTWYFIERSGSPEERAERVVEMGDAAAAERIYWQILQRRTDDTHAWIVFIDSHSALRRDFESDESDGTVQAPSISEDEVRARLAKIANRDVAALASFWYEAQKPAAKPDREPIVVLANREHPPRYANQILARFAWRAEDFREAAKRFEREGLSFPKAAVHDLRHALAIWIDHDMWDEVRRVASDPRYDAANDPVFRLQLAEHDRDWLGILKWLVPSTWYDTGAWPIALALLAAALWFTIAARLGRFGDGEAWRRKMYILAFVLGVISVYPTLVTISVEETFLGFKETGQALPDLIYFVFGVGLREEAWKLILFLPLLPFLLKRGSRIEAMTCGALVGLGFAAEENVQYFRELSAGVAIGRFLTANFLHMALTALASLSLFDTMRGRHTSRDAFNVTFPLVVALHGAYDFLLTSSEFAGGSFLAMGVLFVLCRAFLRQLTIASSRSEMQSVLRFFVWSLALLSGVSYVYATTLVGPLLGLEIMLAGLLGVGILIYMFVRELREA